MGCNNAKVVDDEKAKKNQKRNLEEKDDSMDDNTFQEDDSSNENDISEKEIEININNINKSSNSNYNNSNNMSNTNMNNTNMNKILVSEESVKGIYNLHNGEVRKPKICVVSKNVMFNKKMPEDKKPPDPLKLKTKKMKNEENNIQL